MVLWISILTVTITIPALAGLNYYLNQKSRPPVSISGFKTRFSHSIWRKDQLERAIHRFYIEWTSKYPEDKKRLRKLLNKIDVYWIDGRWQNGEHLLIGRMESPTQIRLWRGPKIKGHYKLCNNALVELLIQALIYDKERRVLTTNEISTQFSSIIKTIKIPLKEEYAEFKRLEEEHK